MDQYEFFYFGKILRRYGNQGAVLAILDVDNPRDYLGMKSVYVDIAHERIPFFIESVDLLDKKKIVLKFEEVSSPDHADAFVGHELYLPLSTLPKLDGKRFYYHEVKGFRVVDEVYGELGILEDILELPNQALFQIRCREKEVLIPAVDEVIRLVDRDAGIIYILAPEGLIDLYL